MIALLSLPFPTLRFSLLNVKMKDSGRQKIKVWKIKIIYLPCIYGAFAFPPFPLAPPHKIPRKLSPPRPPWSESVKGKSLKGESLKGESLKGESLVGFTSSLPLVSSSRMLGKLPLCELPARLSCSGTT